MDSIWGKLANNHNWEYFVSPSTVRNYLNKKRPPEEKKRKKPKNNNDSGSSYHGKINARYPNHIWNIDFTTVRVFFTYIYVFFVIDIYSRKLIYFDVSKFNPSTYWTTTRLKRAFCESIDTPKHLISDNGQQFRNEFDLFCKHYNIKHRRGRVRSWRSNAHIERFNQTVTAQSQAC